MNSIKFDTIANEIINTDKYQMLKENPHHGLNRYIHSMNVAKRTYRITKLLKMDYVSATRGALLHDYFNDSDYRSTKGLKKGAMHPVIALNNARREYDLNETEENIIVSHMFPMGEVVPNCKESWVVTTVDKMVAIRECGIYKLREKVALIIIFIINFINFNL